MLLQSSPTTNTTQSEAEFLYQVSRGIIYASDATQVAHAVKAIFPDPLVVVIYAWQNFKRKNATYLEVIGTSIDEYPIGARHSSSVIPQLTTSLPNYLYVVEDPDDPSQVDPITAAQARRFGYHSLAYVNVEYNGRVLGVFSVGCKQRYLFSDLEKRVMTGIADLVSAALEFFRLHEKTKVQVRELQAVAQISAAAATLHDEVHLLNAIEALLQLHMEPDRVMIYLLHGTRLVQYSMRVSSSAPLDSISLNDAQSIMVQAVMQRTIIETTDDMTCNNITLTVPHICEIKMAVPMIVNQQIIGVLQVCRANQRDFSTADMRLMTTLSDLVAVAIQNTRFFHQAQEMAALEERNRLARELHDSVSQALYGIALGTQTARKMLDKDPIRLGETLDYVLTLADAGMAEMRALIFELRPDSLETEGLIIALAKLGASIQARHGIDIRLELDTEPVLSLNAKESLYRVIREALHNVVKHANAKHVVLRTKCGQNELRIAIEDDGIGFDTDREFLGHLGLRSMRERIIQLGGSFYINSEIDQGTNIQLTVPLLDSVVDISI